MTEGPETSFLAEYIYRFLKNKKLRNIIINTGRYKRHGPPANFKRFTSLLPLKLTSIYKKGKVIFLFFEENWTIIVKLGMSGWFFKPHNMPEFITEPTILFEFENDDLNFTDFRNFGTLTFTDNIQQVVKEIDRLAPDILDNSTTFEVVLERFDKLSKNSKESLIEDALMDQTLLFSGIGNIIKSELLYDAHISPLRKLKDLSRNDLHTIFMSAKKISKKTLKHLNDTQFDPQEYISSRYIYNKETDRFGHIIYKRTSKYGRTTFWVPEIQT